MMKVQAKGAADTVKKLVPLAIPHCGIPEAPLTYYYVVVLGFFEGNQKAPHNWSAPQTQDHPQ
jgi:hypothetical protein